MKRKIKEEEKRREKQQIISPTRGGDTLEGAR